MSSLFTRLFYGDLVDILCEVICLHGKFISGVQVVHDFSWINLHVFWARLSRDTEECGLEELETSPKDIQTAGKW